MTTLISSFGSQDANTYCPLTRAHSIITTGAVDPSAWTDSSTAARQAALLSATREIDAVPWLGDQSRQLSFGQALAFPRTAVGLPRRYRNLAEDDLLAAQEEALAAACSLHALSVLVRSEGDPHDQRAQAGVRRYSYRLGGLSEEYQYSGAAGSFQRLAAACRALLSDFPRSKRLSRS